jgi:hypothetical protein
METHRYTLYERESYTIGLGDYIGRFATIGECIKYVNECIDYTYNEGTFYKEQLEKNGGDYTKLFNFHIVDTVLHEKYLCLSKPGGVCKLYRAIC